MGLDVEGNDERVASQHVGASKIEENGLDVTQAPNGHLIEGQFDGDSYAYEPIDPSVAGEFDIKAVFPYRGPIGGGSTLDNVYGNNVDLGDINNVNVVLGDKNCSVTNVISTRIRRCRIPPATTAILVMYERTCSCIPES